MKIYKKKFNRFWFFIWLILFPPFTWIIALMQYVNAPTVEKEVK